MRAARQKVEEEACRFRAAAATAAVAGAAAPAVAAAAAVGVRSCAGNRCTLCFALRRPARVRWSDREGRPRDRSAGRQPHRAGFSDSEFGVNTEKTLKDRIECAQRTRNVHYIILQYIESANTATARMNKRRRTDK